MFVAGQPAVLALFDIGPMEFLVVIGAAIMLFGGDLPDVARKAGRTVRKLRTLAGEATRNLQAGGDLTRLPGAAEFRQELDMKGDLDLAKDADLDWHEVARLPTPGDSTPPATPAGLATPAPVSAPARSPPDADSGNSSKR